MYMYVYIYIYIHTCIYTYYIYYSICLGNKNAEAAKFLEILQKSFPGTKKEIFCKRKKDFFHKKTFLQDTNYSCASIFIIHTFILYIFNHYSSALNSLLFLKLYC